MNPNLQTTFSSSRRAAITLALLTLCIGDLPAANPTLPPAQPLAEPLPRVPPTESADAAKTFQVLHGFRMELLAAEPLVTDPVAMAYDEDGRAYVCEMNDYPYTDKAHHKPNQENPTDQPIGKVRLLSDPDADGHFRKSTVFAQGLSWPSGVACWKGGVFVSAPPDVWYFKDTDGDGIADVRVKVFTGFRKLNVQAVMNNLNWGLDNRIYGAGSSNGAEIRPGDKPDAKPLAMTRNDFRFDANAPAETIELLSGGARFGNAFDDWGNRFLCNIRNPAQHVVLPSRYLARNPFLPVRSPINDIGPSGEVPIFRISPVEPWRELRARRWAGERDNPSPPSELVPAGMVTSSSGITIYRGVAYPKEFRGNAFTAESGNNVFYRQTLTPDGPTFKAERVDAPHEMVASKDIWFRAVNFVNAPDGTLHVCDKYRENIEHPWSIPDDIHAAVDLESGRDRGRIWRLAPPNFKAPKPPRLSTATIPELVATLENTNAWWRETAQRLLFERQDASAAGPLRELLQKSGEPLARLHALWTLEGLHQLADEDIARGLTDKIGGVREHAVKLAEARLGASPALLEGVLALADDSEIRVRFQAAFTLGETNDARAGGALASIAKRDAADSWVRAAVLSSAAESCDRLLVAFLSDAAFATSAAGQELLSQSAFVVGARNRPAEIARVLAALPVGGAAQSLIAAQIAAGLGDGLKRSGRSLRKVAGDSATIIALLNDAQRRARDAQASLAERERATRLLAYDEFDLVKPALTALLDARQPAEVQRAAVQSLAGFNRPEVAKILLDGWRIYTPPVRSEVVQSMLGFKNRILPLLDAIEAGGIAANQIPPVRRALLLRSKDLEIQARAAKLFSDTGSSPRREVIEKYKVALTLKGDAQRGQTVFEANCMICHRAGDKGTEVGPNLSTVQQWSAEQIMVNILDPNREVAPNFIQYVVELKDGQTVVGLIADETPTSINLRRADNGQQTVLRQNITSMTSLGVSLMPEGVEANINPQQMADLLAFVKGPAAAASSPSTNAAPRLDRTNLLTYRDAEGNVRPVKTVADWQHRRDAILKGMQEVMGPLPGQEKRCLLDMKVEEDEDCGDHLRRLITYQSEPGGRVPAYLLIPKAALTNTTHQFPAVLCLHPTSQPLGNKTVVGLGTNENRGYALELTRRGFVTIAPAYPHLANYAPDLKKLGYQSGTMKAIWDNIRALDLLESLPFVNTSKGFGAIGHSLGGHNSIYTAVFDPRIKVVVSSCGFDSYLDYYSEKPEMWQPGKGWTQERYMPRMADYAGRRQDIPFDFHELIAALAPRPVFVNAPLRDANFKWQSVDLVITAAKQVYELYSVPGKLEVEHPDCPHDFPQAMRERAYELFKRILAPEAP